jgi:cytochrome c biogenesis protein CcdA/thiol-disulfide isomerase/thioredoxin
MLVVLIAFAAGVVTSLSPCVLPVLPVVLATAGQGGRLRPYAVVLGLVTSISFSVLLASAFLKALHLPQDLLTDVAVALLALAALALLWPKAAFLLEKPLAFLTRHQAKSGEGLWGGLLLGASLGFVYVPCAGPVLAAVSAAVASHRIGALTVLALFAFALGAGLPLLAAALGGRRLAVRLRNQARWLRPATGALMALGALIFVVNATGLYSINNKLAAVVPGYTDFFQRHVEASQSLSSVSGIKQRSAGKKSTEASAAGLPDYGPAPNFRSISAWLNTPSGKPLTIQQLRGKVVLVDFWTYSCINCLRTLPHLEAWYARYHAQGLEIVGVHTPEFAFEHVYSNVKSNTARLGVRYPVALDNDYATWDAYQNQYWPAEYLVDKQGQIVHYDFGEGEYAQTESLIRRLLGAAGPKASRPDLTPTEATTPESYLGYARLDPGRYAGTQIRSDKAYDYQAPTNVPVNYLAYSGRWLVAPHQATPLELGAAVLLHFQAQDVYVVLGGQGQVRLSLNGKPAGEIKVTGDRLYTAHSGQHSSVGLLHLSFSPGVEIYSFTFG